MKYFKSLGLCLVAVFALGAVTAATASAITPPMFSWSSGSTKFSSKGGAGTLETEKKETVSCTAETDEGEVEGPSPSSKIRKVKISYTGCRSSILNEKCKSTGANEEEIKTFELEGRTGWINRAKTEPGILFSPETGNAGNPNNLFAEFKCSTNTIRVKGSIIGSVPGELFGRLIGPPSDETAFKNFLKIDFKKGTKAGEPAVKKFEGATEEDKIRTETPLTGGAFIESSAEGSVEVFPLISLELLLP
jgi:hypothetical protein